MAKLSRPSRMRVAGWIVLALYAVAAARLYGLQIRDAAAVATAVEEQNTVVMPIPVTRGSLLDETGAPLAVSSDAKDIVTDQTQIKHPHQTATLLAPVLDLSIEKVESALTGTRRFAYIAKRVPFDTWSRVEALNLVGVYGQSASIRSYPQGAVAGNVIGFTNADGAGAGGIEYALDGTLAGVPGSMAYVAAGGVTRIPSEQRHTTPAQPGRSVKLTINRDLQWVAQRALDAAVTKARASSGTVIVLDVPTGRILAMAASDTFDPSAASKTPLRLLGNPPTQDVYEPGSTAKVLTMAAILEEGAATPTSKFTVPPTLPWSPGHSVFHDHDPHGTLKVTLAGILARSSNIGTILAAKRIGPDVLARYLRAFGIGEPTGLGFPGESAGLLPDRATWSATTFPTLAFGQGMSVTALQAALVYQTIANGGMRIAPTLIAAIEKENGEGFVDAPLGKQTRVVSPQTAATVTNMLETVVTEGTGAPASIPGFRVAGKTGTAQLYDDRCHCYRGFVASFIGFAPADHPRFVVAVSLKNPKNGHFGGLLAGPVFKTVMTDALRRYRVAPSAGHPRMLPLTWR